MPREISDEIRLLMRDLNDQGRASVTVEDDNVKRARGRLYIAAKHLGVEVQTWGSPDRSTVTGEVIDMGDLPTQETGDVREMARATLLREPEPAGGVVPDRIPDTPSSPVSCLDCSASLMMVERRESSVRRHSGAGRLVVGDTRYLVICEGSSAHEYLDTRHKWRVDAWFRELTRVKRLFNEDGTVWDA